MTVDTACAAAGSEANVDMRATQADTEEILTLIVILWPVYRRDGTPESSMLARQVGDGQPQTRATMEATPNCCTDDDEFAFNYRPNCAEISETITMLMSLSPNDPWKV